jgi:hypothetical protein
MNTNFSKNNKNRQSPDCFKDVSRFTRWVNRMDENDKTLLPRRRKMKWLIVLAVLFILFGLSFIWIPPIRLTHSDLNQNHPGQKVNPENNNTPLPFEIPLDSFEQQLKNRRYEKVPETE